jgi:hypothetical protein
MKTPSIPIKDLKDVLVLLSAAILLYANDALAANPIGDAQMQARDLLTGTVNGQTRTFVASPTIPVGGDRAPNLDPQEQARQLILGKPSVGGVAGLRVAIDPNTKVRAAVSGRMRRHAGPDPQKSAQQMILGNRS